MPKEINHPFNQLKTDDALQEEIFQNDSVYQQLLVSYQNGEWDTCRTIAEALLQKYPGNETLLQFREDIEMQLVISRRESRSQASTRKRGVIVNVITVIVILGAAIGIGYGVFYGYQQYINTLEETTRQTTQLEEEKNQAESLISLLDQTAVMLQAGNTEGAVENLTLIQNIDPEYPGLQLLIEETESLKSIDTAYDQAQTLQGSGDLAGALAIYQQILEMRPQYRDVQQLVKNIEDQLEIEMLTETAHTAYNDGDWTAAITNYEALLGILPVGSEITELEESLFFSYLHAMESMAISEETSLEQMNVAEAFYGRAVSLAPQSKALSSERERLANLYNQLQFHKYYRIAQNLLTEDSYSESTIASAAAFLELAAAYDPGNYEVTLELEDIILYRDALHNFNLLVFDPVIENLIALQDRETIYDHEIRQLLYESYIGRGDQSMSQGANSNARIDFETAEIIAWEDDNPVKIFTAQIKIGQTLGKLRAYSDAISYYVYALQSIDYEVRSADDPAFVEVVQEALLLNQNGQYFETYTLLVEIMANSQSLYVNEEVNAFKGDSLVLYADRYNSTIDLIRAYNNLPKRMTLPQDQTLILPSLP